MAPQFPIINEGIHPAEFILSEANGHRSRENAQFADPSTIKPGQPVKFTTAATTDKFATYVAAVTGADCEAITIYGGVSSSGNPLQLAIIARDAEVNGKCINWPAGMSGVEQAAGITKLATNGIRVRDTGR